MLKLAWQPVSRVSEADYYRRACELEGIPRVISSGDLALLSHGLRACLEALLPGSDSLPKDRVLRAIVTSWRFAPIYSLKAEGRMKKGPDEPFIQPGKLLQVKRSILDGISFVTALDQSLTRSFPVHRSLFLKGILHRDLNPEM